MVFALSPGMKRVTAVSAVVGGLFWLIKGSVILVTGFQPPYLFEIAPLFLSIGLLGVYYSLPAPYRNLTAKAGATFAAAAAVSAPIQLWADLFAPELIPQEDTITLLTPFIVLAGIGSMVGALLLGIVVQRHRTINPDWFLMAIPLGFITLMILFIITVGLLGESAGTERLLEVPIIILGFAWIVLGLSIPKEKTA